MFNDSSPLIGSLRAVPHKHILEGVGNFSDDPLALNFFSNPHPVTLFNYVDFHVFYNFFCLPYTFNYSGLYWGDTF